MHRARMTRLFLALLLAGASPAPIAAGKITVLGLFKDKAVVEIDGKQTVLKAGAQGPGGVRLISANSKEAVIEVDGKQATYTVGSHIGTQYAPPPEGPSVQVAPDALGMYFADGTINGYSVKFLVDTGATFVAMNKHQARRIGIDYKLDGEEGTAQTASGLARAYYVTLRKVTVGDIALNDVRAAVIDGDHPAEILLGNSFLGHLDMQRDSQVLFLRKK